MELLTLPELKNTFLFSLAATRQGFRLFVKHLWWLFPIIFVMLAAIGQTMMPVLSKFKFFDVVGTSQVPQPSIQSFVVWVVIASFCEFFFSFVAITLMRPSREAKDWNYLAEYLDTYFIPALVIFPVFLFFSRVGIFSSVWAFAMLFFLDAQPSMRSLSDSLSRGFWAYVRFFPVVTVVYGLTSMALTMAALLLAFIANLLISGGFLIAQFLVWAVVPIAVLLVLPMVFFHLAVINTVYVRIMSKYRNLFFEESSNKER